MPALLRTRLRLAFQRRLARLPVFEAPAGRRLLVIAPHPDDETLACGGLIASVMDKGGAVRVLVLTDGAGGPMGRAIGGAGAARVREHEVRAACRRLGLADEGLVLAGLPDGRLADHEGEAAERIGESLREWQPDLVVFPMEGEGHADHEATNRAARSALADGASGCDVLEYPIWRYNTWPWVPARPRRVLKAPRAAVRGLGLARELTVRLPLTAEAAVTKEEALALHASQMADGRWATLEDAGSGELLAYFRGREEYFRTVRTPPGTLSQPGERGRRHFWRSSGYRGHVNSRSDFGSHLSRGTRGGMPSSRPHVLVFAPPRFTGGSVAVARALAAGLAEAGWQVSTAGSAAPGSPGPRTRRGRRGPAWQTRRALRDAATLWRAVRRTRPDILSVHVGGPQAMAVSAIAARLAGVRRVAVTLHGSGDRPRWSGARRFAARWVGAIAVPSAAERDRQAGAGLGLDRIAVIPNGVAPSALPDRKAARAAVGVADETFVIACVARLVPEKDVTSLLDATTGMEGVGILIAGDGPMRLTLQDETVGRPEVRFLGWLAGGAGEVLAAADLFVLPSRRESFGLVYVEAALAGLPAVAWDIRAVDETIVDGETGMLVPVGDVKGLRAAIMRLRDDAGLRGRMGAAARARAIERFSRATMVERYSELFAGLCGAAAPSRDMPADEGS